MKVIGLTGGIATGKSLVARMLRDLGAAVIEADSIARDVVEPGSPALEEIARTFGREVVRTDGTLDRGRLAAIVFTDESARLRLNAITHPRIRQRIKEEVARLRAADPDTVVIIDVPLLLDTAGRDVFGLDGVIVVSADQEVQINRVMTRDGLSRNEALQRLASQRPVAEKAKEADWVINNSGTEAATRRQVELLWQKLRAARGSRRPPTGS